MYYFSRNGSQQGPYDEAQWQQMINDGKIRPDDLYWKEGNPDWRPAQEILPPALPPAYSYGGVPPQSPAAAGGHSPYSTPSASIQPVHSGRVPETYLWQSIVVTILCCWPLGIPAICYAASVNGKAASGDYAGAQVASEKAKFWCWMACAGIVVPIIIVLLMGGVGAIAR